eukprot:gene3984-7240_t
MLIHSTAVFTNRKVGQAFEKFLKTEHNTDPFHFLLDVQKIKHLETDSDKIKAISEIIDKYLVIGAPKQVNISESSRNFVIENFRPQKEELEKWILEISPEELFSKIFYIVHEELNQDSFHRFVRSKLCSETIKNYKNDPTIFSPCITKKFDYKDEDFTSGIVTDKDIEFAKLVCEDSFTWDLLSTNKNQWVNAYFSTDNYLPDVTHNTTASKYECILPISFHKSILAFMCDESIISDPNAAAMNCLGYKSTDELEDYFKKNEMHDEMKYCKRTNMISNFEAYFGFPFNPRIIKYAFSAHYEPETKSLYCIFKPYREDFSQFGTFEKMKVSQKGSAKKKATKALHMFDYTLRKFQKIDENKTLFQEVTLGNFGGWGKSDSFVKMVIKSRASGLRKSVLDTCSRFSDDVKISDFKEKFNKMNEEGIPMDMYGKLYINSVSYDEDTGIYSSNTTSTYLNPTYQWDQPQDKKFYYFEITLKNANTGKPNFCFGFQTPKKTWKNINTKTHVGQSSAGLGWLGSSGGIYNDNSAVYPTISKYSVGDTVGCFWNCHSDEIFFTLNGKSLKSNFLGARSQTQVGFLYPTITFTSSDNVEFTANFGETKFEFDFSNELPPEEESSKPLLELMVHHEKDVSPSLSKFFNSQTLSDVKLNVHNEQVSSHKIVLCSRSSTLKTLISGNVKEIKIDEKFSKEDFMTTLKYLYTGKAKLTDKNWETVLKCADFYEAKGLRAACFEFMVKSLTTENVLGVLQKAQNKGYEFDATDLIKRCVIFIEKKAGKVMKSKQFLDLSSDIIILILQNSNSCVDELDAWNSCLAWGRHQQQLRSNEKLDEILKDVLQHIRYTLIEPRDLVRYVRPTNLAPLDLYAQAIEYHACPSFYSKLVGQDIQYTKRKSSFTGSTILDEKLSDSLSNLLPHSPNGWELLYQASKNDFTAVTFHKLCDGNANTVVVIKSHNGNIFGGYAELPWTSTSTYAYDTRSFIFSLKNKNGKAPVKFANNTNNRMSNYGAPSYGPTFGGGHDLYICNNSNKTKSSYSNLGHSFKTLQSMKYATNEAKNFLAGTYNFLTTEIEVYTMRK